jgi:urease accessory protein
MAKATMSTETPALLALPSGLRGDGEAAMAGLPLLRLLQLASAALPIGAFAYSQGLEQAVAMGWVTDEASAQDWILGLLASGLGTLDLPVLVRLFRAVSLDDGRATRYWNDFLFASRASAELQAEERHLGGALAKVLTSVGIRGACDWAGEAQVTYPAMFAIAAVRWEIPVTAAVTGYAFAWTEAQVAAATRLCPLGQRSAQRILSCALPIIASVVDSAQTLADDDIGAATPAQAMASALHETLYSRLCRS